MSSTTSILVIGGGLTSASVCRALHRSKAAAASSLQISVWEALDGLGGRFHTEYVRNDAQSGYCDTGAQYVTVTDDAEIAEKNSALYEELVAADVLKPMRGRIEGGRAADGNGMNFIAPAGLSSVVGHMFASCDVRPACGRRATAIRTATAAGARSNGWEVRSADGHAEHFDAVVLTQPLPEQVALLDTGDAGVWLDISDDLGGATIRRKCDAIQYSSRYALSLFFPPSAIQSFTDEIDWVAKYVNKEEDDALVYLCHDSAKRQGGAGSMVSLIAHTSVPYGLKHIAAGAREAEVIEDLRGRVLKLLPWLPEPQHTLLKTWRISQVRTPLSLAGGGACWHLMPPAATPQADGATLTPPLVLAGDAFSPLGSRFDGCVQSGEHAAAAVLQALKF